MGTSPDNQNCNWLPPDDDGPRKPQRPRPKPLPPSGPKIRPSKRDRAERAERIKRQVDEMAGKVDA